ncbi:ABC transporter [Ancylobacter sp. A5.8]|uniref:glycine betaine ABC transporter substrate-binding protein n=1 Tax=Ancylobacter gelatini TaxID=2919920 RepID=UPI001F4E422B|nr:glycine betaine ABC transporter substrate-binding protein [Ancylobacter gelatini]MCJ8143376.1 ABC transporter [Ancylobacter gelatini]
MFKVFKALAGAVVLAGLASPAVAQTVKVGSKNFTEQYVLAEIYAAALENAGLKVVRKINLGGTLIAHQALTTGEIDLYPEYTGTALISVVKGKVQSDPDAVYKEVKDFYESNFKVTWLKPDAINNGYALLVRPETAAAHNLKTLSDLGKAAPTLVLGAGPEFSDRADGLPGLKATYGAVFKEFKQFAKLGLRYDALAAEQIDVANGFATDWQIADGNLVALEDDKHLFPPYYVAPVIRQDTLAANPKIAATLDALSPLLDNDTMRQLNARVEKDREEPKDVAMAFLKEKGVIK